MNTLTQQQKVLALLKELGDLGVNSYDLTYKYRIKQAPTRIRELKDQGYIISSNSKSNRSVNYVLLLEPKIDKINKPQPQPPEKLKLIYDPVKQIGVWRTQSEIDEMNKPKQEVLI